MARQIIKGWFVRNSLEISELKGTKWARFELLVKEALAIGSLTDEQLWEWKERFAEFPRSYFRRYEKRTGEPLPSKDGLEWRTNTKFRRPRTKKPDR